MNYDNHGIPMDLTPEDMAFINQSGTFMEQAIAAYQRGVERALVERLEILLGRVPSNEEIVECIMCGVFSDGSLEYKWKGETFLRIAPMFTPPTHSSSLS